MAGMHVTLTALLSHYLVIRLGLAFQVRESGLKKAPRQGLSAKLNTFELILASPEGS